MEDKLQPLEVAAALKLPLEWAADFIGGDPEEFWSRDEVLRLIRQSYRHCFPEDFTTSPIPPCTLDATRLTYQDDVEEQSDWVRDLVQYDSFSLATAAQILGCSHEDMLASAKNISRAFDEAGNVRRIFVFDELYYLRQDLEFGSA